MKHVMQITQELWEYDLTTNAFKLWNEYQYDFSSLCVDP